MNDTNTPHIVAVTRCDGDTRIVSPGRLLVENGDRLVFQSIEAGRLVLFFPEAFFEECDRSIKLSDGESSDPLTISAEPGCYPYVVYSVEGKNFAVGGSNPIIIIHKGS